MELNETVIEANKSVMIRLPSQNFRIVKLKPGQNINLGKFGTFNVDDIIGKPFGFTYEIGDNRELRIIKDEFQIDEEDGQAVTELLPHENNQDLIDDPTVQNMASEDIEQLKKQGVSGKELIDAIQRSHSAFDKKTQFAQQKYLKRKKQKFLHRFTPEPVGAAQLIDIYQDKDASKIQNMSIETLALMLSQANIRPGGTFLCIDDISGVLTASLLERMGGEGTIVVLHEHEVSNLDALKHTNVTEETMKMVKTISWLDFLHPEEREPFEEKPQHEIDEMKSNVKGQYYRKRAKHAEFLQIRELIDNAKFDACIGSTTLDYTTVVPKIIPAVNGSCPVVMYSEFKEQLVRLTHVLHKDVRMVSPTIMETRVRKYQTLPGRLHPHMTTKGHGGYLLWALKVTPTTEIEGVGINARQNQKKKRKVDNSTSSTPGNTEPDHEMESVN